MSNMYLGMSEYCNPALIFIYGTLSANMRSPKPSLERLLSIKSMYRAVLKTWITNMKFYTEVRNVA